MNIYTVKYQPKKIHCYKIIYIKSVRPCICIYMWGCRYIVMYSSDMFVCMHICAGAQDFYIDEIHIRIRRLFLMLFLPEKSKRERHRILHYIFAYIKRRAWLSYSHESLNAILMRLERQKIPQVSHNAISTVVCGQLFLGACPLQPPD